MFGLSRLATAYSADGQQLWQSDRLADRFDITCGLGCRDAVGSATGESVSRPEISDPAPIRVGADGARPLPGTDPRQRIVWWQDDSTYVRASSERLGGDIVVESVVDGRVFPLLAGAPPDALIQLVADGDSGVLLVAGSRSEVLLLTHARDGRWSAPTKAVPVPRLATGCVAEVAGRPAAVVVDDQGILSVRGAAAVRTPGVGTGVIDCAVTSAGIVVATSGGETTRVDYLDASGRALWNRDVPGTAQLSAGGASELVAVMALEEQRVTVLDRRQEVVRVSAADDARLLGRTLVTVQGDQAPVWSEVR